MSSVVIVKEIISKFPDKRCKVKIIKGTKINHNELDVTPHEETGDYYEVKGKGVYQWSCEYHDSFWNFILE